MKFLCDADRCIDCNACVTACKNENEVPWGINRRQVVTINDGKPGERFGIHGLHALHRRALRGGLPGQLHLLDGRWRGSTFEGLMYRLRLLLLCLPIRRAAISQGGQFWVARQNGQVHVLCGWRRRGSIRQPGGIQKIWFESAGTGKLPLCAEMCSTKSLLAGDGEIIAEIYKERVLKRGYGSGAWGWMTAYHEGIAP